MDTMMAHQSVIANTHPNGSFFLTNNGTYVQLVNGVLTNVEVAATPQVGEVARLHYNLLMHHHPP